MTALIDLRNVSKTFAGGKVALENLSLTIEAEQPRFIAVVGESGSGKTTLARLLLGMIQPTHGEVHYEGDDLNRLSGARKRAFRRDVQAIFQDPYEVYNPFYRVDHVLTTPVRKFRLGSSQAERREPAPVPDDRSARGRELVRRRTLRVDDSRRAVGRPRP